MLKEPEVSPSWDEKPKIIYNNNRDGKKENSRNIIV